jgi:hypothetical protein
MVPRLLDSASFETLKDLQQNINQFALAKSSTISHHFFHHIYFINASVETISMKLQKD